MLHTALALGKYLELAFWAVDELLVGALGPVQRDLRILLTVRDQERHLDAIQHTVEMDVLGDLHELGNVLTAPNPTDVIPIVRHREVALALQPLHLHIAPIMVGTPTYAEREARLEGHCTRTVVASEGDSLEADAPPIDIRPPLQVIHYLTSPYFGVVYGLHVVKPQCLTRARLVDHQGRNSARREPARQS